MVKTSKTASTLEYASFKTASKGMIRNLILFFVASFSEGQLNKQFDGDAKECDHLKKVPISGYIHDTSPVKPSRNNYTYFNFKFQSTNGFCDGVCFDKSLYNQVKQKDETQKSVRLSNYSLKRSLQNSNDMTIVINKRTKIESISECPFDHQAPSKRFIKISEIDNISDFTLVSVIGKVHIRSEQSEVKVQERSVMKLDCNIADDTSAIKLTLWDKNIPLVQEGQVYEIVNARVRSFQGEKYLSSNFDTIITTVKSDVRNMIVVPQLMENEESLSLNTITVNRIAGVQEIQRYAVCNSCHRRLSNLQSDLSICDSCGLSQIKTAADETHFSVGVFIGGEHNVLLRVLQDQVESFIKLYNEQAESYNKINVENPTNSEIIAAFLAARELKITFNTKSKLVSSILYSK